MASGPTPPQRPWTAPTRSTPRLRAPKTRPHAQHPPQPFVIVGVAIVASSRRTAPFGALPPAHGRHCAAAPLIATHSTTRNATPAGRAISPYWRSTSIPNSASVRSYEQRRSPFSPLVLS
ncbi:hypothetical protein C8R44DRAFT_865338 [Mycena epipterygia]|nr:hypothetical protein C8R44DRAFT_865338 [Mycena epipterygia]